jgi:hypothetical protein
MMTTGAMSSKTYVSLIFLYLILLNFNQEGMRMTGQAASELQQAIFDRFEISEEDG